MHQTISDSYYSIQHKEPQRVPQDFYQRNKDENVHQPLCIDYPNVTSRIRELSAKTYIKCSQIQQSIQSDNNEISKGKINSSQQDREGKTPYDSTILTKPAIHQDRANS